MQMAFYWWMSLFPCDEDPANRGVVVVQYSTGMKDPKPNPKAILRQNKLFEALPIEALAYHIVLDSRKQNSLAFQVIKISSRATNVRTIFHFGHHVEVQYDLGRFGIDTSKKSHISEWLYQQ